MSKRNFQKYNVKAQMPQASFTEVSWISDSLEHPTELIRKNNSDSDCMSM